MGKTKKAKQRSKMLSLDFTMTDEGKPKINEFKYRI